MTRLCVVATGGDADALVLAATRALEAGADMVELRLDHLGEPERDAGEALEATMSLEPMAGALVVASVRASRDGGLYPGPEDRRLSILDQAARSGIAWVDLEGYIPPARLDDLAESCHLAGTKALVSWHVGREEDWDEVGTRCRAAVREGPLDAVKVVLPVEDRQGLDGLMGFSWSLTKERVPHVLLPSGRLTRIGRLLAPVTDTEWVYTEVGSEGYVGPLGLPLLSDLEAAWGRMGMRWSAHAGPRDAPPMAAMDAGGEWTLLAILGDPVSHTNSPVIHQAALRSLGMKGAYVPYRTSKGDVINALGDLAAAGAVGCNVTVPLKLEAARSVDALGDGARRSGAVNTVVFAPDGTTRGENTDADGVAITARELLGTVGKGSTALVLGTGGAARGAATGMADWGARVLAAGRDPDHLATMVSDLDGLVEPVNAAFLVDLKGQVDLLVQCTSQGMTGVPPEGPLIPARVLETVSAAAVIDMVYAPGGTDLVRGARLAGLPAAGGERVLLHQAVAGFRHWTGLEPPVAAMERALSAVLGV